MCTGSRSEKEPPQKPRGAGFNPLASTVGVHLEAILKKYGITFSSTCATKKFCAELNQMTIEACAENVRSIGFSLYSYGKARGWLPVLADTDHIVEKLDAIVEEAIRRAGSASAPRPKPGKEKEARGVAETRREEKKEKEEEIASRYHADLAAKYRGEPTTFIYPYLAEAAEGDELLYSVRSVEKNYVGTADIWIIGDRPKWWARDDRFIPCPKIKGGARIDRAHKLQTLMQRDDLPDEFVWMQDDIYFVKPLGYEFTAIAWTRSDAQKPEGISDTKSGYTKQKHLTFQALRDRGCSLEEYGAHVPKVYRRSNLKKLFETYDMLHEQFVDDILYCNEFADPMNPPMQIRSLMHRARAVPTPEALEKHLNTARMHNHTNGKFRGPIEENLKKTFITPCQWEKTAQ
jgi:hypothetical protein